MSFLDSHPHLFNYKPLSALSMDLLYHSVPAAAMEQAAILTCSLFKNLTIKLVMSVCLSVCGPNLVKFGQVTISIKKVYINRELQLKTDSLIYTISIKSIKKAHLNGH